MRLSIVTAALLALASGPEAFVEAQPLAADAPEDYDQEREEYSEFWERAITPNSELYGQLVAQARALSFESSPEARARALEILGDAIRLDPDRPEAFWELGLLHKRKGDWKNCASALDKLFERAPKFRPKGGTEWAFDVELGTCHALAENYPRAIRFFKRILARGQSRAMVHRLIGESYMALGQLRRAIEYFQTARRLEGRRSHSANFALAVAYDRDERSAAAERHLDDALERDPTVSRLASRTDFIPGADRYYYLGLAHSRKNAAWALIYFRHYLDRAGSSVWRGRAGYHVRELESSLNDELPLRLRGSARTDEARIRAAIDRKQSALAACTAGVPELLLRVKLRRVSERGNGPSTRSGGVTVLVDYAFAQETETVERVVSCVDRAAAEIDLPSIRGAAGSHLSVEFPVLHVPE